MLRPLRAHDEYVEFVNAQLASIPIPKAHEEVPAKLALLDLTPIRVLVLDFYSSDVGCPAYPPEDMMRTFMAMVFCGITSPTEWAEDYLKDPSLSFYPAISERLMNEERTGDSAAEKSETPRKLLYAPRFCSLQGFFGGIEGRLGNI